MSNDDREAYRLLRLREHPEKAEALALWFSQKWGIPCEAYRESMTACLLGAAPVPQWYGVWAGDRIAAGLGVIENDFHNRPDLAPNVCAVYTEPADRCRGLAGRLLQTVCDDMKAMGVDTLYLLTDHTSFYERYGWEYLCPVQGDGEETLSRMYRHRQENNAE